MTTSIASVQSRPRILFVTSHWPLAPAYGAQQRVLNIGKILARFADVSWVIAPSEQEEDDTAQQSKSEFNVRAVIRPFLAPPTGILERPMQRIRHELDRSFIATDHYRVSDADRSALLNLIAQNDVVWVHTIRTAHWFRIPRWFHSVLDIDDLPSAGYQSTGPHGNGPQRRIKDRRMAWIWKRRESYLLNLFDVLTVCSEDDKRSLGLREGVHVIPNGSNPQTVPVRKISPQPVIGFIGNCGFPPNEEGLRWFVCDVWPLIRQNAPSAQFRLIGSGSETFFPAGEPGIKGLGWLADPKEEIASWSAMIVPIRMGSGTRVKVADGFARKCPVVSTAFGAFGYGVENGRELMLADNAHDFASACLQLIQCPALGEQLADRAYARFLQNWTWDSFQPAVETAVHECLERSKTTAS